MIGFYDFVPQSQVSSGRIFQVESVADLRSALDRANAWISENKVNVINVETVVLPNIHDVNEDGSEDTQLRTSGDFSAHWYQIIRVWFQY